MATRLRGRCGYPADDPFRVTLHKDKLGQPLQWKKPRRIFVCSMGDLFHEDVSFDFLLMVFAMMKACPEHTFQVLTKRACIMRKFVQEWGGVTPAKNIWLGVTVENQTEAECRIPFLLDTPAAVRFVSCEPLLGEVKLCRYCKTQDPRCDGRNSRRFRYHSKFGGYGHECEMNKLDWVICGGESGANARPMNPGWVRGLRYQCLAADVPFFFKQWGEWSEAREMSIEEAESGKERDGHVFIGPKGEILVSERLGKSKTGNLLDGKTWQQFPEIKA
jgi:protein gp37